MNAYPRDQGFSLPEHRAGAALRAARLAAGIGLREMARRLNYGSHSSLSEYEKGARMPSEAIAEAYERLLRLKPGTLTAVLEAANLERHGDTWAKRRIHAPLHLPADPTLLTEYPRPPLCGPVPAVPRAAASGGAQTPLSAFPAEPVADGADPDAAGCSLDAITVYSRRIALSINRVVIGHIELRHCRRASAAWGRFEGYASLNHLAERSTEAFIMIAIERHSDGALEVIREPYCYDLMWSNLLTTDHGTFLARASVVLDSRTVATGETAPCKLLVD